MRDHRAEHRLIVWPAPIDDTKGPSAVRLCADVLPDAIRYSPVSRSDVSYGTPPTEGCDGCLAEMKLILRRMGATELGVFHGRMVRRILVLNVVWILAVVMAMFWSFPGCMISCRHNRSKILVRLYGYRFTDHLRRDRLDNVSQVSGKKNRRWQQRRMNGNCSLLMTAGVSSSPGSGSNLADTLNPIFRSRLVRSQANLASPVPPRPSGLFTPVLERSSCQSVNWTAADAGMRSSAVRNRHTQDDFVGTRRISDHNRHGIEMVERPRLIPYARAVGRSERQRPQPLHSRGINDLPPPTAARIGLPNFGWIIAPPCSTSPATPTMAALPIADWWTNKHSYGVGH